MLNFIVIVGIVLSQAKASPKEVCTKMGYDCVFPFTYQGQQYEKCIATFFSHWCGIKKYVNVSKEGLDFDYCASACPKSKGVRCTESGKRCKFPFEYEGRNYTRCIPYRSLMKTGTWCSTSADRTDWDYCSDSCDDEIIITTNSTKPKTITVPLVRVNKKETLTALEPFASTTRPYKKNTSSQLPTKATNTRTTQNLFEKVTTKAASSKGKKLQETLTTAVRLPNLSMVPTTVSAEEDVLQNQTTTAYDSETVVQDSLVIAQDSLLKISNNATEGAESKHLKSEMRNNTVTNSIETVPSIQPTSTKQIQSEGERIKYQNTTNETTTSSTRNMTGTNALINSNSDGRGNLAILVIVILVAAAIIIGYTAWRCKNRRKTRKDADDLDEIKAEAENMLSETQFNGKKLEQPPPAEGERLFKMNAESTDKSQDVKCVTSDSGFGSNMQFQKA